MHYYCQTCLQCRGLYAWAPWQPHWHGIPLKLPIVFLDSNLWSHAPGSSGSRKQIPSRMNETKTSVHTTEGIHTKYANRCTDTSSRHTNIMQAQPTLCLFPTWSVNGREWGVVVGSWGKTHVSVFHCCLVPVHKFHQWVPERSRERREKERDTNNQAAIRKPVCPRVPADFPYKCSSVKLPADSRFSQILTVSPSWLLQRSSDREVSTAVSVYVRGSVYVRALSEWGRVFVWKRS